MTIMKWLKDQFDPDKKIERLNKAAELERSRGKLLAEQAKNKKLRDKISPPKKHVDGSYPIGGSTDLAASVVGINFGGDSNGSTKKRN